MQVLAYDTCAGGGTLVSISSPRSPDLPSWPIMSFAHMACPAQWAKLCYPGESKARKWG